MLLYFQTLTVDSCRDLKEEFGSEATHSAWNDTFGRLLDYVGQSRNELW